MIKIIVNFICAFIPNRQLRHKLRYTFLSPHEIPYFTMGEHSYCFATMVAKGTKIGKYCSIATGVWIHPDEHKTEWLSTSPNIPGHIWNDSGIGNIGCSENGCEIGNDVWIGLNAIILQSCKNIGHGAVVAAGAVVNKDIPPYAIVGGVPAKIIKYRFPEAIRERLLQSEWWNLPDETLATLPVDNIEQFLKCDITIKKVK